ncbi:MULTISPECIES: cytochrome c oxidase assembly protein [unclassified Rhizobacter]|uniref:cytochrome c oxidase assembly protein n=1 Tax=unclassified Rhizobacter TaxID=2640088 RepID=UPI0006FF886C|nr:MULTISPECIES: cytochrome c oxidase assembly protein [unclassified Rhizobacter]KQU71447.1 cytochrome C oxidase assembly protein [Rhizobacter sp. Root29]KQW13064.1 cytochrome C oxidase assembly protein [Rhizobacter sp. Root1238]KRB14371.1 cytochrome C oxidase assembly protein [Rhizobacter sp. Root16D2]
MPRPRHSALPALLLPAVVVAHPGTPAGEAAPASIVGTEPWVFAWLALSIGLYAIGTARLWRHAGAGRGLHAGTVAAGAAGFAVLALALASPVDALADRLFAAHMVQHELLMVVAAPLLVLGRPLAAWAWALPPAARQRVGGWLRHPAWRVPWRALTHPLSAWSLHALALWAWHLPLCFEAALRSPAWHALQHASFLGTALLFWWCTLAAVPRRAIGGALLSLFTTMLHTGALGALFSLSPLVWYPHYLGSAPVLGLDPLEDQQLGGLIMWVPAGAAYLAAALWQVQRALQGGGLQQAAR